METRKCPNCGKEFGRKPSEFRSNVSFCSVACRMANVRKQRETVCKNCGKHFYPEKRRNRKDQQYCSQACMGAGNAQLDYDQSFLNETQPFLDGFLLGDGSISKNSPHVTWSLKHDDFDSFVQQNLKVYDPCSKEYYVTDRRCKEGGYRIVCGRTKSHPDLKSMRRRWYPQGRKFVPKDVDLSPASVKVWYLSDGSITKYSIALCTDGFTDEEVDFLISGLRKMGIPCGKRLHDRKPRIVIPSSGLHLFFDYVGWESPVECYQYKFPARDSYAHRDRGYATQDRNMSML
jgi:hypothetical protein